MTTLTTRPQGWLLGWWRYGRCWARGLTACHLTIHTADTVTVPERLRIDIGSDIDSVLARMLPGQCPADWHGRTIDLAAAFGADHCRAELVGPATVELLFFHADSLLDGPILW
ncbi:hypothetical protein [Nocardia brasiliensis]|uniref:hypothetical protein n=1 Tax=Nocardia brasiliensis TaxID=37326 RepID=UPI0004A713E2|nr:hypothetical protein [Nocardia brasiliensis]